MDQMFFFNISSVDVVADTLGYIQREEQLNLVPDKQKIFTYSFNYFDVDEKNY